MSKNLLWLLVIAAFVMPLGCSSEEEEETPAPPAPWGPNVIGVGDNAMIMVGSMGGMWTNVPAATSGLPAAGDIKKVVKVPTSNRLVAIVNRGDTTDSNAEIWYNDAGGTGAWTKAWYGTSATDFTYLDAEHRTTATTWDDWDLNDILFVSSTEGYAVGNNYILLRTYDAGATWRDMNVYEDGTAPVAYQEIGLTAAAPASFVAGATVAGNAATPGAGTIIAVNEYSDDVIIAATTAFTTDTTITVGTDVATISSTVDTVWACYAHESLCLAAVVGATGAHTLFIGQDSSWYWDSDNGVPGVWRVVSNATAGAGRTFTFVGPARGQQRGTGEIGVNDFNALFFFDATTGCAATNDGVWYTTTGLAWTQFAASDNDGYYGFVYSSENLATTGYLYSMAWITGEELPGRVAVTYSGTAWSFGGTPTWVEHGDTTKYGTNYLNQTGFFLSGGKIFAFPVDTWTNGPWGWCGNYSDATMDNTLWQDTSEQYMGGTLANGNNSAYQKEIFQTGTTPTTGTVRWIAVR